MSVHYRRGPGSTRDDLGAAAVSVLVGAGVAAVTFYVTRLFLTRERVGPVGEDLGPSLAPSGTARRLSAGTTPSATDD